MRRLVVLACGALLSLAPAAQAAPAIQEFPLPTAAAQPQDIVQGLDNNMWFTERGANKIGRVVGTTITEFPIAAGATSPDIIVVGPDGALWFTEANGVGRMPPGNPAGVTAIGGMGIVQPRGIAVGPDGNLWVADADAASPDVHRISPAGAPVGMPIPLGIGINPRGIAKGPDGNMWVGNFSTPGSVVRVTPGGTVTNFPVTAGTPIDVIGGSDGNIWYAGQGTTVGKVTPGGTATAFTSKGVDPFGITVGPDKAVWFAEFQANAVGRVDAAGNTTHVTGMTAGAGPRYVSAGPGGTVWFTEETGNRVGRVTGIPLPGGGGGGGGTKDTVKPKLARVTLSTRRPRSGATITIRYRLSEPGTVTLVFQRALPGRKAGKRCVKQNRSNRGRKRCTRYVVVKPKLTFANQPAGPGTIRFTARVKAGKYRLSLGARDIAGNRAKAFTVPVTVRPRKR